MTWLFLEDFPFFPRIDLTTEQITLAKTKTVRFGRYC
jgi:hypothetical protein